MNGTLGKNEERQIYKERRSRGENTVLVINMWLSSFAAKELKYVNK